VTSKNHSAVTLTPLPCPTPLHHAQSGTFTEFHFQASGAQASAAGSTCLRDGYPPPAFTRTSRWLSSRPCKLLQFSSWLAFDLESQTYRKRQSGDNLCDRTAVTRRSRATLWRRQAMKTRRGAAKKVKTASEQTPDFRHRGKTSGGGHFQGASVFREMQAFFPSVSRLNRRSSGATATVCGALSTSFCRR
jgi:hypothetical protein